MAVCMVSFDFAVKIEYTQKAYEMGCNSNALIGQHVCGEEAFSGFVIFIAYPFVKVTFH